MLNTKYSLYLVLVIIRIYFSLIPSVIHPDEQLQTLEPAISRFFKIGGELTWEFKVQNPIRSLFIIDLWHCLPLTFCSLLQKEMKAIFIFRSIRVFQALSSFIIDGIFYHCFGQTAMLLFATSHISLVYLTHTLSNSSESILLCCFLFCVLKAPRSSTWSCVLGILSAIGIFNRPTFVFYCLLPVLFRLRYFLRLRTILSVLCFAFTSTMIILYDSRAYLSESIVCTPLNFLKYNSDTSNLATHGIHSKLQHLFANLPMLLGPGVLVLRLFGINEKQQIVFQASAISGLVLLSFIPHQEARFILPAAIFLLPGIAYNIDKLSNSKNRKTFWSIWILYNTVLSIILGGFHQNGIIQAFAHLGEIQRSCILRGQPGISNILSYQIYQPPMWPLLLEETPEFQMIFNKSKIETIQLLKEYRKVSDICAGSTVIVKPAYLAINEDKQLKLQHIGSFSRGITFDGGDDYTIIERFERMLSNPGVAVYLISNSDQDETERA